MRIMLSRPSAQVVVGGRNHYLGLCADEKSAAEAALAFRSDHLPFSVESP